MAASRPFLGARLIRNVLPKRHGGRFKAGDAHACRRLIALVHGADPFSAAAVGR